ncbi:protein CREG2 isoform X1 [Rhincodon typus]|uniref:protein CREG2 isoform X1 n=1 Tax=Rhincodon typus TaxID=259920 RepID=UPI00202F769E|nr:protein CREG2 isoform X1 [Rhincodon typus]
MSILLSLSSLAFLLVCLVHYSRGYVIVNSVSWAVTNQEEAVSAEVDEDVEVDVLPNRLFESSSSIWKASYPAAVYQEQDANSRAELPSPKEVLSFPSRMFSYRREGLSAKAPEQAVPEQPQREKALTARYMVHSSNWGFLATLSTLDKIKGVPFGNILSISDGLLDNSTGVPFFYVSPVLSTVADLMNNPSASLTLSKAETDYCRQNVIDLEDSRCARLTLTGQVVTVPADEIEFARQAMFSRHPVMKKWPPDHNWFFMKMNIQHVWLQDWFGGVAVIPLEDYFKASPMNIE